MMVQSTDESLITTKEENPPQTTHGDSTRQDTQRPHRTVLTTPLDKGMAWYHRPMEETDGNRIIRNEDGTFKVGTAPGPGRPEPTPEALIVRKAIKEIVKEYKESLADVLPELEPVLKDKALSGDMVAIKEIHDQVIGKAKETHRIEGEFVILGVDVSVRR
jgi:hypothetical protein